MYDSIIIGSGPAGISASLYMIRAGLKILIISKNQTQKFSVLLWLMLSTQAKSRIINMDTSTDISIRILTISTVMIYR